MPTSTQSSTRDQLGEEVEGDAYPKVQDTILEVEITKAMDIMPCSVPTLLSFSLLCANLLMLRTRKTG